jgi:hypothetical protein
MNNFELNNTSLLNKAIGILRKKMPFILFIMLLFFALGWYYKSLVPTKYSAKSIFYPDKEATLSGSPLELINGTTTAKGGALTILAKVLTSHSMTYDIAGRKINKELNLKYSILADWIIDDNNKRKMPWENKDDYTKMSKETRVSKAAGLLRSGCFAVLDESGFMSLINNAYSENLALYENKSIIDELINFNFNKKTDKAKRDLEYLSYRADSLRKLYGDIKYEYASFDDANKFIIKKTVGIPKEDLEEQKKVISQRYFKIIELQEQAFIRFQTDKPIVEILDEPYIDSVVIPSKLASGILYALLALILSSLFFLRNFLIAIIQDEISKAASKKKKESLNDQTPDSVL